MAACKILSHSGAGLYAIELLYDTTQHDDRVQELSDFITDIENINKLDDLNQIAQNLWDGLQNGKVVLDGEIDQLNILVPETAAYVNQIKKINQITAEGLKAGAKYKTAQKEFLSLDSTMKEKTQEYNELLRVGTVQNPLIEVWCVDLADGVDGRNIYVADQLVPLWCMNYDTGLYVLPPLNLSHLEEPDLTKFNSLVSTINGGGYNVMRNFTKDVAPASTFYNVAMEVGFARWQPQMMKGVFFGSSLPDCRGIVPSVIFPVSNSRFGQPLLSGTFKLVTNFYMSPGEFRSGDEIVCSVTFPENDPKSKDFNTPEVHLMGFLHDPRTNETGDQSLGYHSLLLQIGGVLTGLPVPGTEPAYSDFTYPDLRKVISKSGRGESGDLSTTGVVGTSTVVVEGYDLSGVSCAGVTYEDGNPGLGIPNMAEWFAKKSTQELTYTYKLLPDTSLVYNDSINFGEVTWTVGYKTPRGEWLTYTLVWGGVFDDNPDSELNVLVPVLPRHETYLLATQRKSASSFGKRVGHSSSSWISSVVVDPGCIVSTNTGPGSAYFTITHPNNKGQAVIFPNCVLYRDRQDTPENLY